MTGVQTCALPILPSGPVGSCLVLKSDGVATTRRGLGLIPVAAYGCGPFDADSIIGGCVIDPSDWDVDGATTTFTLELVARVTRAGLTGTISLYDITADAIVGTTTITSATSTRKTISVPVPGARHLYRLLARIASPSTDADFVALSDAVVRVTWS